MRKLAVVVAMVLAVAGFEQRGFAQDASVPPPGDVGAFASEQLDQLLGPVALYPDPLLALILPASTFPQEIVMADRYISQGGDPNQVSAQPWDSSVQGLTHYPNVLKWMDDNLSWTTEVGHAFASQQSDVMDSIQRLRGQAQAQGNLQNTSQETIQQDDGDIDIEPTNPDEIYVPDYQPDQIYSQPGVYCTFGVGWPIGAWLGFDWDWHYHHLVSWGSGHPRPGNWWHMAPSERRAAIGWNVPVWRPHGGGAAGRATGDRGYGEVSASRRPTPAPRVPLSHEAPRASASPIEQPREREATRPAETTRAPEFSRPVERAEPAPSFRSESPSIFGGSQSAPEARASSQRGQESRGFSSGGGGRSGGSNHR